MLNPYQSPNDTNRSTNVTAGYREARELLTIVSAQRIMMRLLLLKMVAEFSYSIAGEFLRGQQYLVYLLLFVLIQAMFAYFIFRIMQPMYGVGAASAGSLIALLPCLGTLTVLILNGNIVDYVRLRGLKLGFLGATKLQMQSLHHAVVRNEP